MKRQATDWRYLQIIYRLKDLCTEHKKNSYDSIIMRCTTQFQNEQPHETSGITGQGVWQIFPPKSNDKIWQNYQNNHFRTLEMDQWHATNWETFTQENLLNLGKNSGIWHFSLEYLPLHPPQPRTLPPHAPPANTHTQPPMFYGTAVLPRWGGLWGSTASLLEGVEGIWNKMWEKLKLRGTGNNTDLGSNRGRLTLWLAWGWDGGCGQRQRAGH